MVPLAWKTVPLPTDFSGALGAIAKGTRVTKLLLRFRQRSCESWTCARILGTFVRTAQELRARQGTWMEG